MKVNKYNKCSGGGGTTCNLEDKRVTPSMGDRDENNLIVVEESEGYDGLSRVVIDPQTIYNEGINEQKSKLVSINITENGTYNREDGYNKIVVEVPNSSGNYDEGYNQGQADIAANARVLEVTENGNYLSKFSDPVIPANVTGVYADGTKFYSYAELTNIVYNTGIKLSENTKIEIWYKPRDLGFVTYGGIIGPIEDTSNNAFNIHTYIGDGFNNSPIGNVFNGRIKFYNSYYKPNDLNKWFHLELSFADGFVVDGVVVRTYDYNISDYGRDIYINKYTETADGYYGMIKIDDTIIIPAKEGFLNTSTGELLEVVENGSYIYTNNEIIHGEGELYKTINVNVIPKINVKEAGVKLGNSTFTEVPECVDFEGITDMSTMFNECRNLQTIPLIDTSNVINANGMFYYCSKLKTLPNNFNFGNCNNLAKMFYSTSLTDYSFLETWVINPNANMDNMIDNTNTTYVPAIPCVGGASYEQSAIFFAYGDYSKLTYFGGWIGRKYNVDKDNMLKKMPNLTYESCISILNNLYDFTGNGETPDNNQGKLKVHQNFLDKVGDEISIGTAKGWQITV